MGHQFLFDTNHINLQFKMFRVIVLSAVLACAYAAAPAPSYGKAPTYDESPKPYAYEYAVQDDYSNANFAASETSDGKAVTGSYTVHLPDGRVQTVTYTADHYNGYV